MAWGRGQGCSFVQASLLLAYCLLTMAILTVAMLAPVRRRAASVGPGLAICALRPQKRPVPTTFYQRHTATCRPIAQRYRLACSTSMTLLSVVTRSCLTTARYTGPIVTATALPLGRPPPLQARSSVRPAAASRGVLAPRGRGQGRGWGRYGPSVTGHDASIAHHSRCGWPATGAPARPRGASSPRRWAANRRAGREAGRHGSGSARLRSSCAV